MRKALFRRKFSPVLTAGFLGPKARSLCAVAPHTDHLVYDAEKELGDWELGCVDWEAHMPGDPRRCRLNAVRCLAISRLAISAEEREALDTWARTWKQLAAEAEADNALLQVFAEMEFGEPSDVLPIALGLLPQAA
jgi:hypothetical protein